MTTYSFSIRQLKTLLLLITTLLFVQISFAQETAKTQGQPLPTVLVLGDSLSAAYGIPLDQGWVHQLQGKLKDSYRVINASISGETTVGGLRSLPSLIEKFHPEIVIIELGANDGLRGFPLQVIEGNLRKLVTLSKQTTQKILLLGVHIPPNYGKAYALAFHDLYSKISKEQSTGLVPFFLEGIATETHLMQDDGLHPKAEAQPRILKNIFAELEKLL